MKMKSWLAGLAGAVVILGAGAASLGFLAQGWMARRVEASLGQPYFTKATHGALRYSLWRGRLEIDDLALETTATPPLSLAAAHIEVDGLGPAFLFGSGGPGTRLAIVRGEKVALARADTHEAAATLTLTGLSFPAGSDAPADLAAMVDRIGADRLEMGEARLRTATRDTTFATLAAERFANGRFATLSATQGKSVSAGGLPLNTVEFAELHMTGADYRALQQAFAPEASPGDPLKMLVEGMSVNKLAVTNDATHVTVASLTLAGLQARPGGLAGERPDPLQLLASVGLDRAELADVVVAPKMPLGADMTVARLAVDKLQPGRLGGLTLETIACKTPQGAGRLGTLEITGLAYATSGRQRFFVDRLHAAGFAAGTKPGAELSIKDVLVTMDGSLAEPSGGHFKVGSILIPATLAPALIGAGYNELMLDFDGGTRYDAAQQTLEMNQVLTAHEAGTLSLSLRLEHYPAALEATNAGAVMALMLQAELAHAELRYEDASLVERLLKLQAQRTGRDVESARAQMLATVEAQRKAFAGKPGLLANLDAVAGFLREPRTLTLVVAPPAPLPLGRLSTLAQLGWDQALALLGLTIR